MVVVRPGTSRDLEAALRVWRLAIIARRGGDPVSSSHEEQVRGYLGKPDAFFVVAEDGGDVVGMALGMQALEDDGAGPPIAGLSHISMVFVHPARWGRRIGERVLLAVMDEARRRGFARAQLWTHADNGRARRLYERNGFVPSGRVKDDDLGEQIVHYGRELADEDALRARR